MFIFTPPKCDYYCGSSNKFSLKKYSAAAIKFESRNFTLSLYFAFIKDTNDSYMEKYYPIINAMITLKCLFSLSLYSWQYVCSQFSSSYFLNSFIAQNDNDNDNIYTHKSFMWESTWDLYAIIFLVSDTFGVRNRYANYPCDF